MIEIYVVRHGTTEANEKHKIMGQLDTPLTNHGMQEAEFLAEQLKDIKFDAIFASDLGRAFITEFIIAKIDHEEDKIHESKELREINYGDFQNLDKFQISEEHPEYKTDANFIFPNGESFIQVQKRVLAFIDSLKNTYDDKKILLVSHAGVIRCLLCGVLHKNLTKNLKISIPHTFVGKIMISDTIHFEAISQNITFQE